jgi:NAD(P)-dependent dehydrogenase (short-subunit alcohol dehydrogenase family)
MARVWFITGCSRGLGRSLAEAVLKSGDSVVATARKSEQLSNLVEQYGSDRVLTADLNVADNDQVLRVFDSAISKFGRIDVLVNNAGTSGGEAIEHMDIKDLKEQLDTNFYGVVHTSKAAIPIMRKQQSGRIIQVNTIGLRNSVPGLGAYQSSKWAIGGFSGVLAVELAPFNIKVTTLEPGGMKTDMADGFSHPEGFHEDYRPLVAGYFKRIVDGKEMWSEPSEVADAIIRLSKHDEPPARLLIGRDAAKVGVMATEGLLASDKKWHEFSNFSQV